MFCHTLPDDPCLVQAELRISHPSGEGWYEQFDEFPDSNAGVTTENSDLQGSRYFWPPLRRALITKKRFGMLWQSVAGKPYEFQRGDGQQRETLKVDFFFRLLDSVTDEYVGAFHCFQFLKGMDPNDKT